MLALELHSGHWFSFVTIGEYEMKQEHSTYGKKLHCLSNRNARGSKLIKKLLFLNETLTPITFDDESDAQLLNHHPTHPPTGLAAKPEPWKCPANLQYMIPALCASQACAPR